MSSGEPAAPVVAIVYESMFGNTRRIAEAIADGIRRRIPVTVLPVSAVQDLPPAIDVLLIGAPTHVHGLSRPETRAEAVRWAATESSHLTLDDAWTDTGIREWLARTPPHVARFAAFDTRVDMPRIFAGSAAGAIERRLKKLGSHPVGEPSSFVVDKASHLVPGELERARGWGAELAAAVTPVGAGR